MICLLRLGLNLLVLLFAFRAVEALREKVGESIEAAVADDDDMACCKDLGREADRAKAAAATATALVVLLMRSLDTVAEVLDDSNCKRGCLNTKLLGFVELLRALLVPLLLLVIVFVVLLTKFVKTFETDENVEASLALSAIKSLAGFRAESVMKVKSNKAF